MKNTDTKCEIAFKNFLISKTTFNWFRTFCPSSSEIVNSSNFTLFFFSNENLGSNIFDCVEPSGVHPKNLLIAYDSLAEAR